MHKKWPDSLFRKRKVNPACLLWFPATGISTPNSSFAKNYSKLLARENLLLKVFQQLLNDFREMLLLQHMLLGSNVVGGVIG